MIRSSPLAGYSISVTQGRVDSTLTREITAFWAENHAIPDADEAVRRVGEVICVARNVDQEIVGVNSVYVSGLNQPAQTYYFYRIFIRQQDRVLGLSARMREMCIDYLRRTSADSGVLGLAMITENAKLMRPAAKRMLIRAGWQYVGRGPLGRDAWIISFDLLPSL